MYTLVNDQTVQFSITHFFAQLKCQTSIWPIDRTLSGATTLGQGGPGSDDNEGVFHIPQSSSIIGVLPSDCLVLNPGH